MTIGKVKTMEQIIEERISALKEDFSWERYSRIKDMIDTYYRSHDPLRYTMFHKLEVAKREVQNGI